jgi:tRNA (cytidine/uridine-2'-O-)-methyltransferase
VNIRVPDIALWEPEIPPNTGNIARLCAATGSTLHLIGPVGFRLDERSLRRAGLDYWNEVRVVRHSTLEEFEASVAGRLLCFSAHAKQAYTEVEYRADDCLLFGGESFGLPPEYLSRNGERSFRIPMLSDRVRSLNLATAVGIALYETLRQLRAW